MTVPKTALEGIRVLDLGRYQAGPRAGLIMARLGAEVIKVEPPGGEESRGSGGGGSTVRGQSPYWVQYNSGKKSIAIDLRQEAGKQVLRDLVKVSDVFMQNFRPGTIEEMGFGYEALRSLNKGVVMLNVSAYGQYGPYRDRIGFDQIGQAISGMMWMNGYPENPPTINTMPLIDRITSLHGTIGVLAALRERELSGEGQAIDVSLADSGFSMTEIPIVNYLGSGVIPRRDGSRVASSLSNVYRTTDGWAYIVGASDNIWGRLCEILGKPEWLNDARFSTRAGRGRNAPPVEAELAKWFAVRATDEAVNAMSAAGVPCAPVNDVPQAAKSPQVWERELLVEVPDPLAGKIHVSGKFIKLSRSQDVIGSAPIAGEHTTAILRDLLHYSPTRIEALRSKRAIASPEDSKG